MVAAVYLLILSVWLHSCQGFLLNNNPLTVEQHEDLLMYSRATGQSLGAAMARTNKSGVVLIPGLVGTQLEAKWSNWSPSLCTTSTKGQWKSLWLDLVRAEIRPSCTIDKLAMQWEGDQWTDIPNVQVRYVRGLAGCEYLDPSNLVTRAATSYWAPLSSALQAAGYKRGFDLFGAGYDWRLGGSVPTWRALLKQTIELSHANTGKRVVLVAHSMGVMQTTLFLSTMTQSWKDKYIKLYIAAAGPTLGAPGVVKGMLSGREMIPGINDAKTWKAQHFSGTGAFASVFGSLPFPEFSVTIKDTGTVYNAADVPKLFSRVGLAPAYAQQAQFQSRVTSAPNVTVLVVYSTGLDTQVGLVYPSFPVNNTVQPTDTNGDGDGTVPTYSATYPLRAWPSMQSKPVSSIKYSKVSHIDVVKDKAFLAMVVKEALQ